MLKFLNIHSISVAFSILNFLIEMMQGPCLKNQKELAKSKIINATKDLMYFFIKDSDYKKRGFITFEQKSSLNNLIASSNKTLLSMVEGKII